MKVIVLIGVTIYCVLASLPAQCWSTLVESQSCSWYTRCLQQKFQCGNAGYPLGYGFKYCNKFSQLKTFPAARQWIQKTLICLKQRLVPTLQENVQITCKHLKNEAYDIHPQCYYEGGFCELFHKLGFQDSAIFLKQLLGIFQAKDFQSISAMKQIQQMAIDCWKLSKKV